jgi:hypothetical protein
MNLRALAPLAVLVLAGCGATTSAQSSPSTAPSSAASVTPTPATPRSAIIVHNFLTDPGSTYSIALVGQDGRTAATVTAAKRTARSWFQVSSLSASSTRLYYLDGNADIRSLRPDGSGGLVTHLNVPAGAAAAFAVSPDDSRVAVSIMDINQYPATTRIYVEDLSGGGHHVDLLQPTTALEWPIGWHNGRVVVAFGLNVHPQNYFDGFLWGHGYQVLDASSGQILADVCKGLDAYFPPVAGGATCGGQPAGMVGAWNGTATPEPVVRGCALDGALSPDGSTIASRITPINGGCGGGASVNLVARDGHSTPTHASGLAVGWLDAGHFIVRSDQQIRSGGSELSLYDIATATSTPIDAPGFFAGSLPGSL